VYYLVYVSKETRPFGRDELYELLEWSRAKNARLGITGILLYKSGRFMQLLEGEREIVETVYAAICTDSRHSGVVTINSGEIELREFPHWSMAFRDMDAYATVPGYSDFMNTELTPDTFSADPTCCQRMLLAYKSLL